MFSATEKKVLKIIGRKKMTITDITKKLYKGERRLTGNNSTAGVVRRINMKCYHHDLKWCLDGRGAGRAGRTVWRDKQC